MSTIFFLQFCSCLHFFQCFLSTFAPVNIYQEKDARNKSEDNVDLNLYKCFELLIASFGVSNTKVTQIVRLIGTVDASCNSKMYFAWVTVNRNKSLQYFNSFYSVWWFSGYCWRRCFSGYCSLECFSSYRWLQCFSSNCWLQWKLLSIHFSCSSSHHSSRYSVVLSIK